MRYFSSIAFKGSAAFFFILAFLLLFGLLPTSAAAQELEEEVQQHWLMEPSTYGHTGAVAILLLGFGCVACSLAGAISSSKGKKWDHWQRSVRGLGEGAFLVGVLASFGALHDGLQTVAALGATITPSELANGIAWATTPIMLGAVVALAALLGSGLMGVVAKPAAG